MRSSWGTRVLRNGGLPGNGGRGDSLGETACSKAPSPAFLLPFPRRQDHTQHHTCPVISHAKAHEGKPSRCCPSDVTDSLKLMSQPKILTDITHTLLSLSSISLLFFSCPRAAGPEVTLSTMWSSRAHRQLRQCAFTHIPDNVHRHVQAHMRCC